jgi:hypothetical protein
MHPVGFEPTISVLECVKTVNALDRATSGTTYLHFKINMYKSNSHYKSKR